MFKTETDTMTGLIIGINLSKLAIESYNLKTFSKLLNERKLGVYRLSGMSSFKYRTARWRLK